MNVLYSILGITMSLSSDEFVSTLITYAARFCALIPVLVLHEFAHAYVAHLCGDDTAKWNGRLTLNPLKHFDVVGLVLFLVVGFGWASPVPINPNNFKNYKRDLFFTASAGVFTNLVLAFLFCPLMMLTYTVANENLLFYFIYIFFLYFFSFNITFFVFNLIPLFPLDGFRIWDALDKRKGKVFQFLHNYGYKILLGLIIESYLCRFLLNVTSNPVFEYLNILGFYLEFVIDKVATPIQLFWGLFI
jgi:Zn-dependent protease